MRTRSLMQLPTAKAVGSTRCLSDGLSTRKKALEDMYFNEENNKLMQNLTDKMQASNAEFQELLAQEPDAHELLRTKEFQDLTALLQPYNLPKSTLYSVMKWKHGGKFVNDDWTLDV